MKKPKPRPKPTLRSCPFCGGSIIFTSTPLEYFGEYARWCLNCHASGPRTKTINEATKAWNKRA